MKSMQREVTTVQNLEHLAGALLQMTPSGNEESSRLREILIQKTEEMETLRIKNKEQAEMIEQANEKEVSL